MKEQAVEQPQVQQDQASMVLNPSMGSNDSSQHNNQFVVDGPPMDHLQVFGPVREGVGPAGPVIQHHEEEVVAVEDPVGPFHPHNEPAAENFVEGVQIANAAAGPMDDNQFLEDPVLPEQNDNLAIVPHQPPLQPPLFVGA